MANLLTISRFLLIPVFIFLVYLEYFSAAFAVFAIAALTDALDGIIARHVGKVTEIGKTLDPLADRLLITAAAISLVLVKLFPLWALLIIGIRDFAMISGYILLRYKNLSPPEITLLGKLSSALLAISMAFFILKIKLGFWFLYPGIASSLISGLDYINKGNGKMKELKLIKKTES